MTVKAGRMLCRHSPFMYNVFQCISKCRVYVKNLSPLSWISGFFNSSEVFCKMQICRSWNPVMIDLFEIVGIRFIAKAVKKIIFYEGSMIYYYTSQFMPLFRTLHLKWVATEVFQQLYIFLKWSNIIMFIYNTKSMCISASYGLIWLLYKGLVMESAFWDPTVIDVTQRENACGG